MLRADSVYLLSLLNEQLRLTFPKTHRLLCRAHYSYVFNKADRLSNPYITLLYRKNDLGIPRLGLMPSKKAMRRAVARNVFKRMAREGFRLHQHQLPAVDVILLPKKGVKEFDQERLCQYLNQLWEKLARLSKG